MNELKKFWRQYTVRFDRMYMCVCHTAQTQQCLSAGKLKWTNHENIRAERWIKQEWMSTRLCAMTICDRWYLEIFMGFSHGIIRTDGLRYFLKLRLLFFPFKLVLLGCHSVSQCSTLPFHPVFGNSEANICILDNNLVIYCKFSVVACNLKQSFRRIDFCCKYGISTSFRTNLQRLASFFEFCWSFSNRYLLF